MRYRLSFYLFCLMLPAAVSGCGKTLSEPYDMQRLSLDEIQAENSYKADGFAAELCVPGNYEQLNADGIEAESFALFSLDDFSVISQQKIFDRVYPASTTKILTCLIALERGNSDDIVTVPEAANITVSGSSMANLKVGDRIRMKDLLYGLMVPSGNDAAEAIAYHIAGSSEAFAELMNEKAKSLGATQSHFVNPHGLPDDNHYTTVYDMYLIFNEAIKSDEFRDIANRKSYEAEVTGADGEVRTVRWDNGNMYFRGEYSLPPGISMNGGKTGHTNAAGYCLVLGETADSGKEYISIVFKAGSYDKLYGGMNTLLEKIPDGV